MYVNILFNIICLLLFCPCSQSKGVCSEIIYWMNLIQWEIVVTDKNNPNDTGSNLRPNARWRLIADVKPTQPSTTTEDKEISTVMFSYCWCTIKGSDIGIFTFISKQGKRTKVRDKNLSVDYIFINGSSTVTCKELK